MLQGKFFVERLCIFERKSISCYTYISQGNRNKSKKTEKTKKKKKKIERTYETNKMDYSLSFCFLRFLALGEDANYFTLITLRFDRCTAGLRQAMVSSGCVSFSRLTRNHSKSCYENELKDHLFQKNCQINKRDRETKQQKEIVGT